MSFWEDAVSCVVKGVATAAGGPVWGTMSAIEDMNRPYQPNQPGREEPPPSISEDLISLIPGIGEGQSFMGAKHSALDATHSAFQGDWGGAGSSALDAAWGAFGVIPGVSETTGIIDLALHGAKRAGWQMDHGDPPAVEPTPAAPVPSYTPSEPRCEPGAVEGVEGIFDMYAF